MSAEVSPDGMREVTHPQPDITVQTHGPAACAGRSCCIHDPSDHPMRDWPLVHRTDEPMHTLEFNTWGTTACAVVVSERVCGHGMGHPDPDSIAFISWRHGTGAAVTATFHGCDGCCALGWRVVPVPEDEE